MNDYKDLIATARRAEGSEMLHKISFGRMNAETLILRLADALEAAMTTPDAEEIARLCADLIAVREQVAVAYRAAVNAAFEPTQGKHSGPLLGYLTGATPPPADAAAYRKGQEDMRERAALICRDAVFDDPIDSTERFRNRALTGCEVKIRSLPIKEKADE